MPVSACEAGRTWVIRGSTFTRSRAMKVQHEFVRVRIAVLGRVGLPGAMRADYGHPCAVKVKIEVDLGAAPRAAQKDDSVPSGQRP